jgi:uncharacterized membrane protein
MFTKVKHIIALTAGKKLLNATDSYQLGTGKRIISILAGAFLVKRGIDSITKSPIMAIQELALGGLLLYNGATGTNGISSRPQPKVSGIRQNQIQGNDPKALVPEFV